MSKNRKLTDFFRPTAQSKPKLADGNGGSTDQAGGSRTRGLSTQISSLPKDNPYPESKRGPNGNGGHLESRNDASARTKKTFRTPKERRAESEENLEKHKRKTQQEGNGSVKHGLDEDKMDIDNEDTSDAEKEKSAARDVIVIRSSDDEEDDSDSSLEDINSIFKRHRSLASIERDNQRPVPQETTSSLQVEIQKKILPPKAPAKPVYTISMDELAEAAEKDRALDAKIESIRATTKVPAKDVTMKNGDMAENGHSIDSSLLASVIGEDSEQGEMTKVMIAINRTEALNKDLVWYFFHEKKESEEIEQLPFPQWSISKADWKRGVLADPIGRTRPRKLSRTGDASHFQLPDAVSIWMLQQLCLEPTEQLRDGYFMTLLHDPKTLQRLVTPEILPKMFMTLGATPAAVDLAQVVKPISEDTERPDGRDHSNLCNVIDFLGETAPHIKTNTREAAVCFLLRLCIDRTVVEDGEVQLCLGEAISNLVQSFAALQYRDSLQHIKAKVLETVRHVSLIKQLLQLVPCLTPRLHMFRVDLARVFFFNDSTFGEQHSPIRSLKTFSNQLNRPEYQILPDTNYRELADRVTIFDIALDDGVPAYLFADDQKAEEIFNEEVDELAAQVKHTSARIRDNGALYMSRTAAKELLDRVHLRLIFSLRTKPAKKRAIFGSEMFGAEDESVKKEAGFMKSYLASKSSEGAKVE